MAPASPSTPGALHTRTFTLLPSTEPSGPRTARRICVHPDTFKPNRLATGDIVAVAVTVSAPVVPSAGSSTGSPFVFGAKNEPKAKIVVGTLWPSADVGLNSIALSPSHLFSTNALQGAQAQARLIPLTGPASSSKPPGLPSVQHAKEARRLVLVELDESSQSSTSSGGKDASEDARNSLWREGGVNGTKTVEKARKGKETDKEEWLSLLVREHLVDLKYILHNQLLQVTFEGRSRIFSISRIVASVDQDDEVALSSALGNMNLHSEEKKESTGAMQLWIMGWDLEIGFEKAQTKEASSLKTSTPLSATGERRNAAPIASLPPMTTPDSESPYASVGGLSKQIAEIRDLLEIPLMRPDLFCYFGLKPPRGILLHGPPGTGKTHLARAIAQSTRSSVLVINGPELSSAYHELKLREVFKEAHAKSPCIVVLDEVDALVPRREDSAGGEVEKRVVATLLTILDGMGDDEGTGRVVVIGTTNRPNAIDPALRRPGRFDREFEIGIPDAAARLSILTVLLRHTPHNMSPKELEGLASKAHGYVGADLGAVVREGGTRAIKRWAAAAVDASSTAPGLASGAIEERGDKATAPMLTLEDLEAALPLVRPSAMRSLFVDSPPVRWAEIGGQADTIQKLREAVEWPLLHPEAFKRLGAKPPKGVLLYGPPGCSKTVLARACATESGVNFVAVKGPELLNKFVGESERAVREVFRKARAASPSIIFFDEIDALATSRTSSDTGGSSHEGVLTSLLNEMGGVQELVGVTVVAATNRPDVIDSALMRPGRLDRILYVGPPDLASREEIFKIKMKGMTIGEDVSVKELALLTDGCSGAEITALCQEAALQTMRADMDAPHVPHSAFVDAAKGTRRQITTEVLRKFEDWRRGSGLRHL
ncbi:AAA family ATPase [Coprinopsis sp. MPI-PUGE-AT-0042]|nr:AAA family ATPase [Coprinopsis sp. MPI-PUGE-AT-0042]